MTYIASEECCKLPAGVPAGQVLPSRQCTFVHLCALMACFIANCSENQRQLSLVVSQPPMPKLSPSPKASAAERHCNISNCES